MRAVEAIGWACVLCGCHIQNDWASRATKSVSNFALSLNIPLQKLFGWFRRSQLWATGDWQLHHNNAPTHTITSHKECFGKTSNHPGDSAPLEPRFGALRFPAFPKTRIIFEREEISDHWWDSGKCDRAADGNWENWVRSQSAYFEEDWGSRVLRTMFLVSSSTNVSIFHIMWLNTFWIGLILYFSKQYFFISLAQQSRRSSRKRSLVIYDFLVPVVCWQRVFTDMLEGPGVLTVPYISQFVACNIAPKQDYSVLKSLETWH